MKPVEVIHDSKYLEAVERQIPPQSLPKPFANAGSLTLMAKSDRPLQQFAQDVEQDIKAGS